MNRLAFMTFGRLLAAYGEPEIQGFRDRVPVVYDSADSMPGFVARSIRDMATFQHSWGETVVPQCWGGEHDPCFAATLSVWDDIESVAAFAYHGAHGEAMKLRKEWFTDTTLPEHVAWWIGDRESVPWSEAAKRMDHLHQFGSTVEAFSLRSPFAPDGTSYKIQADLVRQKISRA